MQRQLRETQPASEGSKNEGGKAWKFNHSRLEFARHNSVNWWPYHSIFSTDGSQMSMQLIAFLYINESFFEWAFRLFNVLGNSDGEKSRISFEHGNFNVLRYFISLLCYSHIFSSLFSFSSSSFFWLQILFYFFNSMFLLLSVFSFLSYYFSLHLFLPFLLKMLIYSALFLLVLRRPASIFLFHLLSWWQWVKRLIKMKSISLGVDVVFFTGFTLRLLRFSFSKIFHSKAILQHSVKVGNHKSDYYEVELCTHKYMVRKNSEVNFAFN